MFFNKKKRKAAINMAEEEDKLHMGEKTLVEAAKDLMISINDINLTLKNDSLCSYERNIKNIIRVINEPIFVVDNMGLIKYYNDKASTFFGDHNFDDKNVFDLFEFDGDFNINKFNSEDFFYNDIKIKKLDDKNDFISTVSITNITTPEKENIYLFVIKDISEQIMYENYLKEQKNFFYTLLNLLPVGIFVKDVHEKYTFVNNTFLHIMLKEKNDLLGKKDIDVFEEDISENSNYNNLCSEEYSLREFYFKNKKYMMGKRYLNSNVIIGYIIDVSNKK